MKRFNNNHALSIALLLLLGLFISSCKDLTEININPNGVDEENVNPNLILPTILTATANSYLDMNYQNLAGVIQHTQKDAWFESHNNYDWTTSQSWNGYYDILRNNELLYKRSQENNFEFQQGVALVMKAFVFGIITDLWGDAPFTDALKGDQDGLENQYPAFDSQEVIYKGIIELLEQANTLLSKNRSDYIGIVDNADVFYGGDPTLWRKFANSLLLRYYMRLSEKLPDFAKDGVEKIAGNPAQYPIITSADEDATMSFPGNNSSDSWPHNTVNSDASGSNYRRLKMCATLVDKLQEYSDPRLGIWANRVQTPLVVDASLPAGTDQMMDGKRYLSPDVVGTTPIDTDEDYVGMPPAYSSLPSAYNMNPTPGQTSYNPHVSFLNDIYTAARGDLLRARLLSAAEVHFILAEAALKGWNAGDAEAEYKAGIEASFQTWTVSSDYADYLMQSGVEFNSTIEQVIEQKWIAAWTASSEAWFDYRRTGYPQFEVGPAAVRRAMPLRFYYLQTELDLNGTNAQAALDRLENTAYVQADGKNSAWARMWVLQGTGKPY